MSSLVQLINRSDRVSYWAKCLFFFFTVSMIYFTYAPRTIDLNSSSTVREKVWSTSMYSPSHLQSSSKESNDENEVNLLKNSFHQILDNSTPFNSFSQRAIHLTSLTGASLPNEFTVYSNYSTWICLVNVNSYFSSKNLTIFLTDPLILLKLVNNSQFDQVDLNDKSLLNLGILVDETNLPFYSKLLIDLCNENNIDESDQSNSTVAKMICDTSKYSTDDGSTFIGVNHLYISEFCVNQSIQLSVFHKKSSQQFYFIEEVNSIESQNQINHRTSYYGTLGSKQLFDPIELKSLHLNLHLLPDTNDTLCPGDLNECVKMQNFILIPDDIIDFCLQLYSSKYLPCSEQGNSFTYPSNESVNYNTKMSIVYLKRLLRPLHVPFWLMSGSLLGWFRECRAIPYTTDADFAAFSFSLNSKLVDEIFSKTTSRVKKNNLRLFYRFGIIQKGFELSFKLPRNDWKIDLFFMYPTENSSLISTVGHAAWNKEYYNYYYPSIDSLCSTILLDEKVNVPCNVKQLIETEYGHDWMQPKENYSYVDSPSNRGPVIKWLPSDGTQVKIFSLVRG